MSLYLLPAKTITTAVTAAVTTSVEQARSSGARHALLQCNFTYGTSGGTTVDAWVQTSVDQGTTWCDVANFHFTTASLRKIYNLSALTPITSIATPVDGSLASNTSVDGILGDLWRVKYTSTGTYVGATTLQVVMVTPR